MASLRFIPCTGSFTGESKTMIFPRIDESPLEEQRREIFKKWDELGFLEGLEGHVNQNITSLYESHARQLINETNNNSTDFDTIRFPIVRRVYSTISNPVKKKKLITYKVKKLEL